MPLGMVGRMVPWTRQVLGFRDRTTESDNFWGNMERPIFAAKITSVLVDRSSNPTTCLIPGPVRPTVRNGIRSGVFPQSTGQTDPQTDPQTD